MLVANSPTFFIWIGLAAIAIVVFSALIRNAGKWRVACPECKNRNIQTLKSEMANTDILSRRYDSGGKGMVIGANTSEEIIEVEITRYRCRNCEHQWDVQTTDRTHLRRQAG